MSSLLLLLLLLDVESPAVVSPELDLEETEKGLRLALTICRLDFVLLEAAFAWMPLLCDRWTGSMSNDKFRPMTAKGEPPVFRGVVNCLE